MTRNSTRAAVTRLALAAAAAAAVAGTAAGQAGQAASRADTRWQGWLGCWAPAVNPSAAQAAGLATTSPLPAVPNATGTAPGASLLPPNDSAAPAAAPARPARAAHLVCVTPAAGTSAVDVSTVADGKVVGRAHIDADGKQRPVNREGCSGWESAQWSANGARVYLSSELTCAGQLDRRATGVFAFAPSGEWLDVQSVAAGSNTGVRALRYYPVAAPATLPAEVASALTGNALAESTARVAAGAQLTMRDLAEVAQAIDPAVMEAWLVERGQTFKLDAKRLAALADAGVPGRVTDVMIALSNPTKFAFAGAPGGAARPEEIVRTADRNALAVAPGRTVYVGMYDYLPYDYYGYSPYSYYGSRYGAYGYGYGNPYLYGWYGAGGPIIVVPPRNGTGTGDGAVSASAGGRAVKGRGYVRDGGGTGAAAEPRSSRGFSGGSSAGGGATSSAGSGASSASSGGYSSGGSSASSGSGRTAQPRDP